MVGTKPELLPGDFIVYPNGSGVGRFLGTLLAILERIWREKPPYSTSWGWHTALIYTKQPTGYTTVESIGKGVNVGFVKAEEIGRTIRAYRVLDETSDEVVAQFATKYVGKSYDVAVYFWTMAQYLLRHFWNRRIPRLLDDRFTCWELTSLFYEEQGTSLQDKWDCPMLSDMLRSPQVHQIA